MLEGRTIPSRRKPTTAARFVFPGQIYAFSQPSAAGFNLFRNLLSTSTFTSTVLSTVSSTLTLATIQSCVSAAQFAIGRSTVPCRRRRRRSLQQDDTTSDLLLIEPTSRIQSS